MITGESRGVNRHTVMILNRCCKQFNQ